MLIVGPRVMHVNSGTPLSSGLPTGVIWKVSGGWVLHGRVDAVLGVGT